MGRKRTFADVWYRPRADISHGRRAVRLSERLGHIVPNEEHGIGNLVCHVAGASPLGDIFSNSSRAMRELLALTVPRST